MKKNKMLVSCLALSGATLLTACGGGGSSSDGDGGAALSLDSENYATKQIAISANSNVTNIVGLYAGITEGMSLIGEVEEVLVPGGIDESGTINCTGGGTVTTSYTENDQGADQTLRFNGCVVTTDSYGALLLDGSYRAAVTVSSESDVSVNATYNIDGERQSTGEPLQIRGTTNTEVSVGANSSLDDVLLINTIDSFEFKLGADYVAITNGNIRLEDTVSGVEFTLSGKVLGSDVGGYIQLSTPTPVTISDSEACPTAGIIRISSDGTAEVRYGSSAGGTASAVAVWINNQLVESYDDCSSVSFTSGY